MLTKLAEPSLQPHQQRALARLADEKSPGLVAWHSTGSGKTLLALKAFEDSYKRTGKPGLFVVPAPLVSNVQKEMQAHKLNLPTNSLEITSYDKASRNAASLAGKHYGLIAFDEAHKLRNSETKRVRNLASLLPNADKKLLLTGTAGYNNPADLPRLAQLIAPELKLPASDTDFAKSYVDEYSGKLKNSKGLALALAPYVDVYKRPEEAKEFPAVKSQVLTVPMSDKQENLYRFLMQKLPPHLRGQVERNLPCSANDAAKLNAFSTGIRQVSDSTFAHDIKASLEDSPKLQLAAKRMLDSAKVPNFRGVAYSNYIGAGLKPYTDLLRKGGIEPLVFTGGMSAKEKKRLVEEYNAPDSKAKVLLVSSSGGEGLDLKGTRKLQVLEPHFNRAKIEQVLGRGARYKSHAHLPEEERSLEVEEYQTELPTHWYHKWIPGVSKPTSIEQYLAAHSARKKAVIDEMYAALEREQAAGAA